MRHRLDRYLISGMIGPFFFGMGVFVLLLLGVDVFYRALEMIIQEQMPAGPVTQAMAWRMPQIVMWTLPMASIFATLMNVGDLSSHGEVVALRAGGVGIPRLALPTIALGAVVSLLGVVVNGWVVPYGNSRAGTILRQLEQEEVKAQRYLTLRIPESGPPQRVIFADRFDPSTEAIDMLLIWEFREGVPAEFYSAEQARWTGSTWTLTDVKHVRQTPDGDRTVEEFTELGFQNLGVSPWEVARFDRLAQDMTTAELRTILRLHEANKTESYRKALEELYVRYSFPFAALGLALIGLPLGLRPQRTSTGVGLGVSLAVLFAYYIFLSLMRVMGQEGTLHPALSDLVPNFLLLCIGGGLLINASR